jgi:hypothetical protein
LVKRWELTAAIDDLAERKVQAPTHRASGVTAVVNSARFTSFVGLFIEGVSGRRAKVLDDDDVCFKFIICYMVVLLLLMQILSMGGDLKALGSGLI